MNWWHREGGPEDWAATWADRWIAERWATTTSACDCCERSTPTPTSTRPRSKGSSWDWGPCPTGAGSWRSCRATTERCGWWPPKNWRCDWTPQRRTTEPTGGHWSGVTSRPRDLSMTSSAPGRTRTTPGWGCGTRWLRCGSNIPNLLAKDWHWSFHLLSIVDLLDNLEHNATMFVSLLLCCFVWNFLNENISPTNDSWFHSIVIHHCFWFCFGFQFQVHRSRMNSSLIELIGNPFLFNSIWFDFSNFVIFFSIVWKSGRSGGKVWIILFEICSTEITVFTSIHCISLDSTSLINQI